MASPRKVLVTGATGHVGSSTYMVLAEKPQKYDVYALDRRREFSDRVPVRNQSLIIPDEKFNLCDLADAGAIRRAVEGMDVVVHLGADPGDDGSWESLLSNNVVGTYNVFETCRDAGVPRVVAA